MIKSYFKSDQLYQNKEKKETYSKKKYYLKPKKPLKKKPTKQKRHDIVDVDYMQFVSSFPCIVTGSKMVHVHHIYGRNGKVLGEGRNDYLTVPLAPNVHSVGEKSYHSMAESDFIEWYKLEDKIKEFGSLKDWFLYEARLLKGKNRDLYMSN